tara:strand:+ start:659 stop:1510 length:852 start_codon:yes stop_codon:yes gene_type:complete
MKISFVDFWTGFDHKNNFFSQSLKRLGIKFKIVKPKKADVLFFSCFGNQNLEFTDAKKIFFLSEDFNLENFNFDYSISHVPTSTKNSSSFRLPLWKMYLDWFNVNTYTNPEYLIPLEYIDKNNEFNRIPKNNFCSIVYSSEYFFRDKYIDLVSTYKDIDVFGKNKYENLLPEGEYYKLQKLSNYKFSLAMENEISKGYLCEKLIHAKIAGNIPLFYGDDYAKIDFNPNSFIHITDFDDESLLNKIKEIDSDKSLYNDIYNEPLFDSTPNIDGFLDFLNGVIKN